MWATHTFAVGERVSFGDVGVRGFALEAPGDPDLWPTLTPDQQKWVTDTLVKFNTIVSTTTGTKCLTWAPAIGPASQCFQMWFDGAKLGFTKADGSALTLRTDGVFDQDTLDALRTFAALRPKDFPTPFPGTTLPGLTGEGKKKLSTGEMFGIAAGAATLLGGGIYLATRGHHKSRRRR